jgi:hypothetical protein
MMRTWILGALALVAAGCDGSIIGGDDSTGSHGAGGSDGGAGGGNGSHAPTDADLGFCVKENNRYRAMISGLTPFTRSPALEAYAADGARIDGTMQSPHYHFKSTLGGGIASAENEIPWWPINGRTVQQIMAAGIALMWAEGPGEGEPHGHYENIVGPYTQIGCGVFVVKNTMTVTIDFK